MRSIAIPTTGTRCWSSATLMQSRADDRRHLLDCVRRTASIPSSPSLAPRFAGSSRAEPSLFAASTGDCSTGFASAWAAHRAPSTAGNGARPRRAPGSRWVASRGPGPTSELPSAPNLGQDMRVLFVTSRHPVPPNRGDKLRNYHLAKGLARHAEVTLVCFGDEPPDAIDGVRVRTVPFGGLSGAWENLRHPRPDLPMQVRLYLQRSMRRLVDEELRHGPDVVHVHFSRMAPYMPGPGVAHRHLDLMDSLS